MFVTGILHQEMPPQSRVHKRARPVCRWGIHEWERHDWSELRYVASMNYIHWIKCSLQKTCKRCLMYNICYVFVGAQLCESKVNPEKMNAKSTNPCGPGPGSMLSNWSVPSRRDGSGHLAWNACFLRRALDLEPETTICHYSYKLASSLAQPACIDIVLF
jgi:hypothetical protein